MTVSLTEETLSKLKEQTLSLWGKAHCSICEVARVIALIVSSFPTIRQARFYYCDLEVCKLEALGSSDGDYNSIVYFSQLAKNSLQWFVLNSHLYNGTRITKPSTMTISRLGRAWSDEDVILEAPYCAIILLFDLVVHGVFSRLCNSKTKIQSQHNL